jgi:hypothetical protein
MRLNAKLLGILLGIVALTVFVILATRPGKHEPEPVKQAEPAPAEPVESAQSHHSLFSPNPPETTVSNELPRAAAAVVNNVTNVVPEWENKIDEVLRNQAESGDEKAKRILAVFPQMPLEGQIEAAQHIVNLLSDEEYAQVRPYVTNSATPPDVLDELISDLLNRPDSVKLPTLLDIARNPQHPEASDAKDILELYLEEDYGTDWAKWEQKLAAWLKDNPD